jgi:hypothetical protein
MLAESPAPLNFTMFLSLFGDKLQGEPAALVHAEGFSAKVVRTA